MANKAGIKIKNVGFSIETGSLGVNTFISRGTIHFSVLISGLLLFT